MSDKWQDISMDHILDYDSHSPNVSQRYDRILQFRSLEATNLLKQQVNGLTETIYRASQGINSKAEQIIEQNIKLAAAQKKQSGLTLALTLVIAIATVFYSVVSWQSVSVMREANQIQRQSIQLEHEYLKDPTGSE